MIPKKKKTKTTRVLFIAPNGWFFSGCFWHFRRFRSFPSIVESWTRGQTLLEEPIDYHLFVVICSMISISRSTGKYGNYCFDGQNPAPPRMMIIPLFTGFYTSQVVPDFSHQQYHRRFGPKHLKSSFHQQ